MEKGEIELFDDPRVRHSLRTMQISFEDGIMKIFGNYDHIADAIAFAAWCKKDKSLNIWIR